MADVWKYSWKDEGEPHEQVLWQEDDGDILARREEAIIEAACIRAEAKALASNIVRWHMEYQQYPWAWFGALAILWFYVSAWIHRGAPKSWSKYTSRMTVSEDWLLNRGLKAYSPPNVNVYFDRKWQ